MFVKGLLCGPSLRRVGQGILELLIGNGFDTFDPGDLGRDIKRLNNWSITIQYNLEEQ